MRSRPVNPRARRMQLIVASVPLLHILTFCTDGTHSQIVRAISTSHMLGIPKLRPSFAVSCTVCTRTCGACPRIAGPQVPTESISERPSTSSIRHPFARRTKNGSPPTLRNARTGLFTPPGMYCFARAKSLEEMDMCPVVSPLNRQARLESSRGLPPVTGCLRDAVANR